MVGANVNCIVVVDVVVTCTVVVGAVLTGVVDVSVFAERQSVLSQYAEIILSATVWCASSRNIRNTLCVS